MNNTGSDTKGSPRNITRHCELLSASPLRNGSNHIANFPFPLVLMQVCLVNLFRTFFQLILKPVGQLSFVPQILGGIMLGPSGLGHNEAFRQHVLMAPKGVLVANTFEVLGFMFHLFLTSVRLDITIIKKCGKLAFVIGIASFLVPLVVAVSAAFVIRQVFKLDEELHQSLPIMASLLSSTSFYATFGVLNDLKLLNSELGRLALSSSLISGICSFCFVHICINVKEQGLAQRKDGLVKTAFSKIPIVLFIVFALRPIFFWMMRRTPEGKPLKQSYLYVICVMVLVFAFIGEATGQHFYFGPLVLGNAIPDDPPIGSSLLEKMDSFVESVLMPCYLLDIGRRVNMSLIKLHDFLVVESLIFFATIAQLGASMIPSLYRGMPFLDALSLGLILNCQGYFDIQFYSLASRMQLMTMEGFCLLVLMVMLNSTVFAPLVKYFYDPSKRYVAYTRQTIQHNGQDGELRVLACVHHEDNVFPIISILESSNPTRESPISVYVMNLKQAVRGTIPLFIRHNSGRGEASKTSEMDRVINAFRQFEYQNQDIVSLQCFTFISTYDTMHDDVCSMALDKDTSFVIIPFQHSDSPTVRFINKNVLEKAPCSVGILFDQGTLRRSIVSCQIEVRVCVVFIGGADDRETLAFGARMAAHRSIRLTVLRLTGVEQTFSELIERRIDSTMINEFKCDTSNLKVEFMKERVTDGTQTAEVLGNICRDNFDLILAGRRHNPEPSVLKGLTEWSEVDELGVIGDLLASPDFKCKASLLAVQQQTSLVEGMMRSERLLTRKNARSY